MIDTAIKGARVRVRAWAPFVVLGSACVVGGGLLAAVTASRPSQEGMWTVAYLVLVGGVAQLVLGAGQPLLAARRPSPRTLALELVAFNVGNAAVIAGTLLERAWVVDAGGALLVLALALFLYGVRGGRPGLALLAYRLVAGVVLVSIPIGLVLAHIRSA